MRRAMAIAAFLMFLAVAAAAETWSAKIAHPVYKPDTTLADSIGDKYVAMTEDSLRALITLEGGKGINVTMKQAAYDLARLYQKTKKDVYADRAVLLLERFAEVVPRWPMIDRMNGNSIPIDKVDWGDWSNSGLWGIWFHQDLERCVEIPLAYDCISASGALERRSAKTGRDVRMFIEDNLLRYMVELNLKNSYLLRDVPPQTGGRAPFDFSNMGGNRINGIIPFGKVFEPEYIHLVVDWLRQFPRAMYFRDGVWHEDTPSYHLQITNRLSGTLPRLLKEYSDPPGYTDPKTGARFDNLDLEKEMGRQFARMRNSINPLALPNGRFLAIHDTHSDQRAYGVNPDSVSSTCLFGMHQAVMNRGRGDSLERVFFHFGGTDGHEHLDCLNLALWAMGGELLSEGEYNRFGNRDWNMSTAGHNLVVVDEKSQRARNDNRVKPGPDDSVDGLSYNPCVGGHGDTRNFGNLRLWDAAIPGIRVVEAEGENAYGGLSRYRRTLVMVDAGNSGYHVDIFRVKGGNTHDWMLHGQLGVEYDYRTGLATHEASGTRFTHFAVKRQAVTDSLWWSEFVCPDGARIRTTMLPCPGTEVSFGRAPAMRRTGEATFLDVRRIGGDNVFTAVHEPYRDAPRIVRITPLLSPHGANSPAWLKIDLEGGRTDYIAATLDAFPYPERRIPGTDIRFRGRLVHVSVQDGKPAGMYLLEGSSLRVGSIVLAAKSGDFSRRGRITDIKRIEKGDSWDGFVTPASLPADGSLDGKTLLLTLGDGRTEGYTIARIAHTKSQSLIHVNEEPGMELRDGGKLCKLVYFPWHGVRGDVKFLISGSAYRDADGKVRATGEIK